MLLINDGFYYSHAQVFPCLSLGTGDTRTAFPAYSCDRRYDAMNVSWYILTCSLMMHAPYITVVSVITVGG